MDERAKRISEAIEKSGLSYPELERATGISKSSLQRYATGVTKKIPIDCIEKIAEATGSDVRYLMGWEDTRPAPSSDRDRWARVIAQYDTMTAEEQRRIDTVLDAFFPDTDQTDIIEETTVGAELDRRAATDAEAEETAV